MWPLSNAVVEWDACQTIDGSTQPMADRRHIGSNLQDVSTKLALLPRNLMLTLWCSSTLHESNCSKHLRAMPGSAMELLLQREAMGAATADALSSAVMATMTLEMVEVVKQLQ